MALSLAARVSGWRLARTLEPRCWSTSGVGSHEWEACVGLEIHAQVKSDAKAFSVAPVAFAASANSTIDFLDVGYPGTLPVLNQRCVEAGIMTGLALGCKINQRSLFDRKHYFYADMPAGYQITQQRIPIAEDGAVSIGHGDDEKTISIERLHLEHDSGKSLHTVSDDYTLVDLNRSGTGLMEIVTRPDINSGDEAGRFLQTLLQIFRTLETCDGNLAEGSVRVDANVSVRRKGSVEYGDRCEVKNINGVRFLSKAIEYERQRQVGILSSGSKVETTTRNYDVETNTTIAIRGKEDEVDYRYMPEPDLPPLVISNEYLHSMAASLPTMPRDIVESLVSSYGLTHSDAWVLFMEPGSVELFEASVNGVPERLFSITYNWITSELFGLAKSLGIPMSKTNVSPVQMKDLIDLVDREVISGLIAKKLLATMANGDERLPSKIAESKGLLQISGTDEVEVICQEVIRENSQQATEYSATKSPKLIKFFIGQIMRKSKGKANPKIVQSTVKKLLDGL